MSIGELFTMAFDAFIVFFSFIGLLVGALVAVSILIGTIVAIFQKFEEIAEQRKQKEIDKEENERQEKVKAYMEQQREDHKKEVLKNEMIKNFCIVNDVEYNPWSKTFTDKSFNVFSIDFEEGTFEIITKKIN